MSAINSIALGFLIGGGIFTLVLIKDVKDTIQGIPQYITEPIKKISNFLQSKPEDTAKDEKI